MPVQFPTSSKKAKANMKLIALFIILCLLGSLVESEFLLVETEDKDEAKTEDNKGEGEEKESFKSNGDVADTPSETNEIYINKQQAKHAAEDYGLWYTEED